ncbi:MAG: hypothetical protein ACRCWY_10665 [Cellulosilyticaceae bacterium]
MKKSLGRLILALALVGCSTGVFAGELTTKEMVVFEGSIKSNNAMPRIGIVEGDNLTNYDYEKSFYVNKNNGPTLKFYMESYNTDYFTYKIKCNGVQVESGLVSGNSSEEVFVKAQDTEYEIIINNSQNGNRINGFLRVTQDK